MFFTQEDYKKIQDWLYRNSVKDTEFPITDTLNGNEIITIVQEGKNKKVFLKDFADQLLAISNNDFINVSELNNSYKISLSEAIKLVPHKSRKRGQVITFNNTDGLWRIYQFTGTLTQWNEISLWKDVINPDLINDIKIEADEEDLTFTDFGANTKVLSLKDRDNSNGMGYVILRKDKSFKQQVEGKPNTIFEIRYDFDLEGGEVAIPESCILKFEGGCLRNGTVKLYFITQVRGDVRFEEVEFDGTKYFDCPIEVVDEQYRHSTDNVMFRNSFFFRKAKLTKSYIITDNIAIPSSNPLELDLGYNVINFEGDVDGKGIGIVSEFDYDYTSYRNLLHIKNGEIRNTTRYYYGGTPNDGWASDLSALIYIRDRRSQKFENLTMFTYGIGIKKYLDETKIANIEDSGYEGMTLEVNNCNIESLYFCVEFFFGKSFISNSTFKRINITNTFNPSLCPPNISKEALKNSLQSYGDYVISNIGNVEIVNSALFGAIENGRYVMGNHVFVDVHTSLKNCDIRCSHRFGVEDSSPNVNKRNSVSLYGCNITVLDESVPSEYVANYKTALSFINQGSISVINCNVSELNEPKDADTEPIRLMSITGNFDNDTNVCSCTFVTLSRNTVYCITSSNGGSITLNNNIFKTPSLSLNSWRIFETKGVIDGVNNIVDGRYEFSIKGTLDTAKYHKIFRDWYAEKEGQLPNYGNFGRIILTTEYGRAYKRAYGVWCPIDYSGGGAPSGVIFTGYSYFNTTHNKPIWWNGSKWVDATGADV